MYNTCKMKHQSCHLKYYLINADFFQKIFHQVMFVLTVSLNGFIHPEVPKFKDEDMFKFMQLSKYANILQCKQAS